MRLEGRERETAVTAAAMDILISSISIYGTSENGDSVNLSIPRFLSRALSSDLFFDLFSIYGTSGHRQLTSEPDR